MTDYAAAYRGVRERVTDLVGALGEDDANQLVPAAPEWTVRDVLAHLAGVTADVLAGNIAAAGTDSWTAAQVDTRRGRSVAELLAEWAECSATVESVVNDFGPGAGQLVFDAVTHEHDLRGTLGAPGVRTSDAIEIGFDWLCTTSVARAGSALRLVTGAGERTFGDGVPVATVEADRFELLRGMTGRRSDAQIAAWRWDPEPRSDVLVVSPPFTIRADDLIE